MALYVPLDVDFATDPKFLAAGPVAGYLFICSLALAKRTMSDGKIDRSQLVAIAHGVTRPEKHAETLVRVGLWSATDEGWQITSWLKRNLSRAQIEEKTDAKREGGSKGNHVRWHIGDKRSQDCRYCIAEGIAPPIGKRSPKVEAELEVEPKVKAAATGDESAVEAEVARRVADRRRRGFDVGPGLTRLIREDVLADGTEPKPFVAFQPLTDAQRLEALRSDFLLQADLVEGESRDALLVDARMVESEIKSLAERKLA